MGRPREHDAATGRVLLDAAEQLLAEGGPEAVSVRGVAEAVGTSTRAVYSVFGAKAGLISGLAARGYTILGDALRSLSPTDDPAADLVAVGLRGFRPFAVERPHLFRLTFERVPAGVVTDREVVRAAVDGYRELAATIERAQEAGVIDGRPVEDVAVAFHALCQGLAGVELSREPPPVGAGFWGPIHGRDAEPLWRGSLEALVAGLAPRPGDEAAAAPGG